MALPGLQPVRNSNSPRSRADIVATHDTEHSDRTRTPEYESLYKSQIKRATRTRKIFAILTSVFLFVAVIFVIMVEIGNTSNRSILRNIWFIKLNVTNVVPASFAQAGLVNSIARTLGLHDFYQVGLWNFCEGYNSQGVTGCSPTQTLYWFNPVQIIVNELLAGATIQLPSELTSILNIIEVASHWMFALFLTGACLSFLLIFVTPLSVFSRWLAMVITIFTFLAALFITAATVIATVMFIIMRNVLQAHTEVNIRAEVGTTMYALMWVGSAFAIFAFAVQLCLTCCCASRRDVKMGEKRGSKRAYTIIEK